MSQQNDVVDNKSNEEQALSAGLETLATVQNSTKAQDAKTTAVEDILEQNNVSIKDGEAALKALE